MSNEDESTQLKTCHAMAHADICLLVKTGDPVICRNPTTFQKIIRRCKGNCMMLKTYHVAR